MKEENVVPFERFKEEAEKKGKKIYNPAVIQNNKKNDDYFDMVGEEFGRHLLEGSLSDEDIKKMAHKAGLPETASRKEIIAAFREKGLDEKMLTFKDRIADSAEKYRISFDSRPEFSPNQIKEIAEIKIGERYQEYYLDRTDPAQVVPIKRLTFVVLSEPYEKNGSWWVRIKKQMSREEDEVNLADYGILPYKGGHWNIANWIEVI
jgi:hypothetical protein